MNNWGEETADLEEALSALLARVLPRVSHLICTSKEPLLQSEVSLHRPTHIWIWKLLLRLGDLRGC